MELGRATGGGRQQKKLKEMVSEVQEVVVVKTKAEVMGAEDLEFHGYDENNAGDGFGDARHDEGQRELDPFLDLGVKGLRGLKGSTVPGDGWEKKVLEEVSLIKSEVKEEYVEDMEFPEDAENNSDFQNDEDDTSPVIMNPTTKQKKEVFDPYIRSISKANKKVWECLVCGKPSRIKFDIMKHVENHHVKGVFKYQCPHCSKVMDTSQGLLNHIKVHTGKLV